MQEEYIKILQHGSFQWSFSWKWKHAYLFNIHSLTSQFVSGFVGIGYLLFGRNHLAIFILVSARYVFSIFYIMCSVCGFLQIFSAFLVDISAFLPYAAVDFSALFCQFLGIISLPLASLFCPFGSVSPQSLPSFCSFILVKVVFIFLNFSLNFCLF